MNIERNEPPGFDLIGFVFCVRLARGCLGGPTARLEAQAHRLARLAERDPALVWVRTAADLAELRARRASDPARSARCSVSRARTRSAANPTRSTARSRSACA